MSGTVAAEVFRSELLEIDERTSDPATPAVGDMWVRVDINPSVSNASTLGELRIQGNNGLLKNPLVDLNDQPSLGTDVYVGPRTLLDTYVDDGLSGIGPVGFVPVTDQGGALGSPRIKKGSTVYQAHDSLTVDLTPDSVVLRDDPDNSSGSTQSIQGLAIDPSQEWPKIQGRLSGNTGGVTKAYILRQSDKTTYGTADISGLGSNDVFTITLSTNMVSSEKYYFGVDAEGSSYTRGYDDSSNGPYTSPDGNLVIDGGFVDGSGIVSGFAYNLKEIGNINL